MSYKKLLQIRPFRNLWIGQGISQAGDALYYLSFMFMVKRLTGSVTMVGFTGAAEALPYLLVMPYAGVIADRMDRKLIMMVCDLVCAGLLLLAAAAVFMGVHVAGWMILCLAFFLSAVRCFFGPAKSAAIPALVPTDMVLAANNLSSATFTVMQALGLTASALIVAPLYQQSLVLFLGSVLVLNAASFAGSAFFISLLPRLLPQRAEGPQPHPLADFKAGLAYIHNRHDLKVTIVVFAVFRLCLAPFMVAYIAANDLWWGGPTHHGNPATIALAELAFFCGWIVGSMLFTKVRVIRPGQWFCYGTLIAGALLMAMSMGKDLLLFQTLNFLCGMSLPMVDIPMNTYLQVSVEDAFRGRTNSVINMIASLFSPLGLALGGAFVAAFGLVFSMILMGGGLLVAALIGFSDRVFRNVRMPEEEPVPLVVAS